MSFDEDNKTLGGLTIGSLTRESPGDGTQPPRKRRTISLEDLVGEFEETPGENTGDSSNPRAEPRFETDEEALKHNRFYLPVLRLNHRDQWESKPLSQRQKLTPELAEKTCLTNCCGIHGLRSSCCRLDMDDLEHILGPVSEKWIKRFLRFCAKKGWNLKRGDVVIDFEEGKLIGRRFFNNHPVFDRETSYPMMRLQVDGPRFSCKFLNSDTGLCNIYENRPEMCQDYLCRYIKTNFLVKTKAKPNTWLRADVGESSDEEERQGK
jgi:hypothetical protein